MPRFITPELQRDSTSVSFPEAEAHHALRVLRLQTGEPVQLLNGYGGVARAVFREAGKREAFADVVSFEQHPPLSPSMTVCVAMPKGDRQQAMLERLVQLGCSCVQPIMTERSVVRARDSKVEKWQRLADEALKQCGRSWRVEVNAPISLRACEQWAREKEGIFLLADPRGRALMEAVPRWQGGEPVFLLVGPEGGFSPSERKACMTFGWCPWRFSDAILRIETAAELGVGLLRHGLVCDVPPEEA